ncbi:MAG: DUF692 domain-containing protein [Nevskia sp.]|nr:DUF692 domain-containing protein [Nevskia sp.]
MPASAGIGLRDPYAVEIDDARPAIGWLEVHSENYFGHDRHRHSRLQRLRADYPLSLHGVGLSLGSVDPPDAVHVAALAALVDRYQPWLVSEHACWGSIGGLHSNNLMPLPRTREAVDVLCRHVEQLQTALGRKIALENVSTYLEFAGAEYSEAGFLAAVAQRSGCSLLLDLNNLYVNQINHGADAIQAIADIPADQVVAYHLAGGEDRGHTLIDTHSRPVPAAVWALYEHALQVIGLRPALIERDADIPPLSELLTEMRRADDLAACHVIDRDR